MPYNDKEFKTTNVNYLNKDFDAFKSNLIQYAKTYFPNTYRDFNETSPGMMLIEMSAYVGDVLSFYVDQQFQEMMLPLSEERRNIISIAKTLGYKVKPTIPSYVEMTIKQNVGVLGNALENTLQPNYTEAVTINKGWQLETDDGLPFETLDVVDFRVSSSLDLNYPPVESAFDSDGITTGYTLTRKVKAISSNRKTTNISVGAPTQYLKLTLPETNVIDIISVTDVNNGNKYYEVDYLAQDKIAIETHYTEINRTNAYEDLEGNRHDIAVPYTLNYLKTGKRFITEVDDENKTSLIFGNGILRNGQIEESNFSNLDSAGMVFPGSPDEVNLDISLDPLAVDSRMTLGETPANTTLQIIYRVGGGLSSNVPANSIVNSSTPPLLAGSSTDLTITNEEPASGGSDSETIEEIRHKALAFFNTQNRCVTKEDYEARIMNLPSRLGSIAKVYVDRARVDNLGSSTGALLQNFNFDQATGLTSQDYTTFKTALDNSVSQGSYTGETSEMLIKLESFFTDYQELISNIGTDNLATLDVYVLGYNQNKALKILKSETGNNIHPMKQNIKEYINNYRMLTDQLNIIDGKIINFGVAFEVVAHKTANPSDVKLKCIEKIIEYFNIDELQFRQPIYTSDLEYQLMGLDGVRSVNWVQLTQNFADLADGCSLPGLDDNTGVLWNYSQTNTEGGANTEYNWMYDFKQFYEGDSSTSGIVLPSYSPAVFELKYPRKNIRGVVK